MDTIRNAVIMVFDLRLDVFEKADAFEEEPEAQQTHYEENYCEHKVIFSAIE